jgi:succinate dehydrogenase / fumarate reductase flavoprotein subunit
MQGLADGYFILPYTIGTYIAAMKEPRPAADHAEFRKTEEEIVQRTNKLLAIKGKKTVREFHRELGLMVWDNVGMARTAASLKQALSKVVEIRNEFWENVNVPGSGEELNQSLEHAGRVADFLEFAELLAYDALQRDESCGGHFREEHQTEDGEAKRDDDHFAYVAGWEYQGTDNYPELNKEVLNYEFVHMATRSYK